MEINKFWKNTKLSLRDCALIYVVALNVGCNKKVATLYLGYERARLAGGRPRLNQILIFSTQMKKYKTIYLYSLSKNKSILSKLILR
jgi:hypothetical protein